MVGTDAAREGRKINTLGDLSGTDKLLHILAQLLDHTLRC